jgi:hypothetical protein
LGLNASTGIISGTLTAVGESLVVVTAQEGTVTYSASGLPDGLSINASTGLISGTIATGDALSGTAQVALTVSDGSYSSSQLFGWTWRL